MGKVRIKTIGIEGFEEEQKRKQKERHEKKAAGRRIAKAPGLKGGERVVAIGPTVEELEKEIDKGERVETEKEVKGKKKKKAQKRERSKRYLENVKVVKKNNLYSLESALELLKKFKKSRFDETVELHINVIDKGISGTVTLPHGTGKKLRIMVADDAVIPKIEKGDIDFDVLVATPEIMPKLAKVAKILGPRGLMPNPKAGTITDKPEELIKKLTLGQITFKTESGAPIIHLFVGKLSFRENSLSENIKAVIESIGREKIKNITLKSTMSPGIKLALTSFDKME